MDFDDQMEGHISKKMFVSKMKNYCSGKKCNTELVDQCDIFKSLRRNEVDHQESNDEMDSNNQIEDEGFTLELERMISNDV